MELAPLFLGSFQKVIYTNWKGNTRTRTVKPLEIFYGATEYHPEPQWLVNCIDEEGGSIKSFALKDMIPCHYTPSTQN